MAKTAKELRDEIDQLCHEAKIAWDGATEAAKAREDEIRALEGELAKAS